MGLPECGARACPSSFSCHEPALLLQVLDLPFVKLVLHLDLVRSVVESNPDLGPPRMAMVLQLEGCHKTGSDQEHRNSHLFADMVMEPLEVEIEDLPGNCPSLGHRFEGFEQCGA